MGPTRRTFLQTAALGAAGSALAGESALAGPPSARQANLARARKLGDRFDPWIEVEAAAFAHNLAEVRRLSTRRSILAVIPNNAYGLELTTGAGLLGPYARGGWLRGGQSRGGDRLEGGGRPEASVPDGALLRIHGIRAGSPWHSALSLLRRRAPAH